MKTLTTVLSYSRPPVIMAVSGIAAIILFLAQPAVARAADVNEETAFIFNTFAFLIWGALVMWMAAGFTMLEAGSVRTKNASMICMKNIGIYSIAGLAYFFVGYNLMYVDIVGGVIGSFNLLYGPSAAEVALLAGDGSVAAVVEGEQPRRHVGLVLPDGIRGDRCLHRVRGAGRAGQDVVVLHLHARADGAHLPHRGRMDVGRRVAYGTGLPRLRRLEPSYMAPAAGRRSRE